MDKTTLRSYDAFAPQYAKRWGRQWRQTDKDLIKKFLRLVKPKGKMLDAGCGTGDLLEELIKEEFDAYGIDASAGMLAEAKRHIDSSKLQQMDICSLKYPDEMFDGIISLYVLQHVTDLSKAFSELKRVTRKGCLLYISIHISRENKPRNAWYSFPENGGNIYMNYRTTEDVMTFIKKAGLQILDQAITHNEQETNNIHLILRNL
jgi:ubiquinone/menaquinone biosynthesis C-methylase UbiE